MPSIATPDELAAAVHAALDGRTVEIGDLSVEIVSHKSGPGWVTAVLYDDSCLDPESELCRIILTVEVDR